MSFLGHRTSRHIAAFFACYAILLGLYVLIFSSGIRGGTDNYVHYHFSRYSWENPIFFLDLWAKPVYTILSSPFAQFGLDANRLFNLLISFTTVWLSYSILRALKYQLAPLVIIAVISAPIFITMAPTAMTEPLCALVLVLGIFLAIIEKYHLSAITLSFIFLVRSEAFIFLPLFIYYYSIKSRYSSIPFLFVGYILLSLIGLWQFGDFFWLKNQNPYSGFNPYNTGSLFHFAKLSDRIFGVTQLILFVISIIPVLFVRPLRESIKSAEFILLFLPTILFFGAHSFVYWKGIGNSIGLIRVMAVISPLVSILSVIALNYLIRISRLNITAKAVALCLITISIAYGPWRKKDVPIEQSSADKTVEQAAKWFLSSEFKNQKVYYYNTYLAICLDRNPYDEKKIRERVYDKGQPEKGIKPNEIVFWDSHFAPNEGMLPLKRIKENKEFEMLQVFTPKDSVRVWTGDLFQIYVFRKK